MKSLNILIIMDPIESINFKKDTTLAMMWASEAKAYAWLRLTCGLIGASHRLMLSLSVVPKPMPHRMFYQLAKRRRSPSPIMM